MTLMFRTNFTNLLGKVREICGTL